MPETMWARLCEDVDCGLRRGGWYRTATVEPNRIVLLIHGKQQLFPRHLFEVAYAAPTRWTVVAQARNSARIPTRWSRGYAVCPKCRWRQLLWGRPPSLRCEACFEAFEVAWDEPYLKAG